MCKTPRAHSLRILWMHRESDRRVAEVDHLTGWSLFGARSVSDADWSVKSSSKRIVVRFHYHSEGDWIPRII